MIIPDLYANASSSKLFEWVRNLSHMRFGRMEKEEKNMRMFSLINLIESSTGSRIPSNKKLLLSKGRTELDLVRSGLEDMMFEAYDNMSEIWNENDYFS